MPNSTGPATEPPLDHRKGPRRRGEELESAILRATLDELTEVGYSALTMERVAARARTGKAAVYRRWPSRAQLVLDACKLGDLSAVDLPDTGRLRSDVLALLRHMAAIMASPLGDIMRGLLGEMSRDPELAELIRERVHAVRPSTVHVILERAVERGEIERWVLTSRRATVATDLLRNQFLLFGAPVADDVIVDIVDDVYLPLVLSPAPVLTRGPDPAPAPALGAGVGVGPGAGAGPAGPGPGNGVRRRGPAAGSGGRDGRRTPS
ncbi:putative HTH-type transcriptional regulator [Streptomyces hundungensis]|uniref:Putative HTH-type transcriptional regulator n=1 Tax=Streptomyces hundungensis TaxID=1077946 RepID=A0A387HSS5_9ACTN|nr:TetR/AcrR family transcriptional regulator [Streptomyces hundungensis]AYG84547.1 putative HTH-type transcriptional regulator [Streptomyces hundungensis]